MMGLTILLGFMGQWLLVPIVAFGFALATILGLAYKEDAPKETKVIQDGKRVSMNTNNQLKKAG